MSLFSSLGFILRHPLNRNHQGATLLRWLRWQLGSRLLPGPVLVPFVDATGLLVKPGMAGATGNVYCGLHEFEDMALVLHALRSEDLFVDIGANVGSYTILGAATGAHVLAVEPISNTFLWLKRNIDVNGLTERVQALNIGLGRTEGSLRFTGSLDTVNHVLAEEDALDGILEVPVYTLDSVLEGQAPTLIKIDVEGYETEVIAGAETALEDERLLAVIIELNGSGKRYGFDESALHRRLEDKGFGIYRYRPFDRELQPLNLGDVFADNRLYVRDVGRLRERVRSAPRFRLNTGVAI